MRDQPVLSEAEWDLVRELLQRELDELPTEIHHSRSSQYRDELRQRQTMVRELLERLQTPQPAAI